MDLTGPDPLAARAAATPERAALVDAASGEAWTYADLDSSAAALAARLAAAGVEEDDTVGILLETSVDAIEVVHAVFRAGATLAPLGVRLAPTELTGRIGTAGVDHLICAAGTAETARAATADLPVRALSIEPTDGVSPVVDIAEAHGASDPMASPPASWKPGDRMVVAFTSGTTGSPKAVGLTAGNLSSSAVASAFRLGVVPSDRWLLVLPIHHMGGLAPVVRSALYGTAVVVQEGFEPERLARATREHDATGVSLVPTMLRRVFDTGAPLSDSLRFVLLGGASAPPDLVERCEQRGVPVYPTYGMTETASQVATATPREAFEHEGTVGRPLLGTEVTIVGGDGTEQPADEAGEIVVSGPTVTPGYPSGSEDRDEEDGTDPSDGGREPGPVFGPRGFHTGDVGYRDASGRLWVTGRVDDLIVTGGENVSPGEVETVLRDHPAVQDVAVVGLDDPEWGERIGALVVPADDDLVETGELDTAQLRSFFRERAADFKRPRTIRFADEIPRTASGTVDRTAVREQLTG